jgi:hypothetical protein
MRKFNAFVLAVVVGFSFASQSFAGDCAAGREKYKTAVNVQQVHDALAIAFDTKTADSVVAEHGDTLSELKDIAKSALENCK